MADGQALDLLNEGTARASWPVADEAADRQVNDDGSPGDGGIGEVPLVTAVDTTRGRATAASWLLSLASRVIGLISAYGTAYGTVSRTTALIHAEQCGLPVARRGGATRGGLVGRPAPGERHVPRLAWPGGPGSPVPVDVLPEAPAADHDSLLIAGNRVIGPRAGDYDERCHRLADALGTRHFELRFAPRATGAVVTDVHLCPRLDHPEHVEATASFMVAVAGQPTTRPE